MEKGTVNLFVQKHYLEIVDEYGCRIWWLHMN